MIILFLFLFGVFITILLAVGRYFATNRARKIAERVDAERRQRYDNIVKNQRLNQLLGDLDVELYNSDYNDHH